MVKPKYVAAGFRADLETLLSRFITAEEDPLRFTTFSQIWRDMKFSWVFRGRHSANEVHELIDEMYIIILSYIGEDKPLGIRFN